MRKPALFAISLLIVLSFNLKSPLFAEVIETPQVIQCDECDEPNDDECDEYSEPCIPWNSWYCGMSYAVIGLGVAAVAAVAAIVLASGDSDNFH